MKFSNFVIELESFTLSEVSDIPDFRDVSTVANITSEEFLESRLAQKLDGKENNFRKNTDNLKRTTKSKFSASRQNITSTPKQNKTPELPRGAITSVKRPRGRPRLQTSTPIVTKQQLATRTVHFDTKRFEPPKPKQKNLDKAKKLPRIIPDIKPKTDNLLDLIPVDVDCLGLEMDKLSLTSPKLHESEYDSISCSSSESEYHSIYETFECILPQSEPQNQAPKQHMPDNGRPGVKLDMALVGPPSKDIISKLPTTEIYKCDRLGCGFTTSNLTNRKLHSCTRWTEESPIIDYSDWSSSSES